MEICEKLKKARAGAGMTQEQVAEKIGVSSIKLFKGGFVRLFHGSFTSV